MGLQVSISLTEAEAEYARRLVAEGVYPDLEAVLKEGLHRLWEDAPGPPTDPEDIEALRALLEERSRGPFVSNEEGRRQVEAMMARVRAEYGLPD